MPSQNFDTDLIVECDDTAARFSVSDRGQVPPAEVERYLVTLLKRWKPSAPRQSVPDADWIGVLSSYLQELVDLRINHVRLWVDSNLEKFQGDPAAIDDLRRRFDNIVIEIKTSVQLCRAKCSSCYLLCIRGMLHEGDHNCRTGHDCEHNCGFCDDNLEVGPKLCGTPYVFCFLLPFTPLKRVKRWASGEAHVRDFMVKCRLFLTEHSCVVNDHLCGEPCKLLGKRGCLEECTKVS